MKSVCALMFMFLAVLFAFCATAMGSADIEVDEEVMVMSTGPPALSVLAQGETQTYDRQDRTAIAAEKDYRTEFVFKNEYNPSAERSGLLLWFNYTNDSGASLHYWVQA